MGVSAISEQRDIILNAIKSITRGDWKILVVDEGSKKLVDNVVKEDDILSENIANIERIEDRRPQNPDMDAIYLLSPESHIIDILLSDLERRKYRRSYLVWVALLDPQLRRRIDSSPTAQQQLAGFETLSIDFFPRESHLITFRDPWSFPLLYHPVCNSLVAAHMQTLAQKITAVCVSLGEYPKVRYYRPPQPTHEAAVLCGHLARFVQNELDGYAKFNSNFPPPSSRPQGLLIITDRSMDPISPIIHEFTYQAMAHDLLPIKEGDKVYYKTIVNEGRPDAEEKDMEIGEKDEIWVKNRHTHMKDTIDRLMGDFQRFIDENPHFTNESSGDATSLNAIKDMLAGLPQFQNMKEAYSLHLSMAQECMNIFQHRKLPDVALVEQTLATGLDEDYRKPKNIADQLVRLLDDDSTSPSDRLRLIILYVLFKDGLIPEDINRLLQHSGLPVQEAEVVNNLDLLGARPTKALGDKRPHPQPLFPPKTAPPAGMEEFAMSRFEPTLKTLLEESGKGTLDPGLFPYTKPPLDYSEADTGAISNSSLRSAKPTWARNRQSMHETKQRVIVFMAGGATYSESRACYEISRSSSRDVFLATSHMLTPSLFLRQVGDLSTDKRNLDLPVERPPKKAPAHIYEQERPAAPPASSQRSANATPAPAKSRAQVQPPTAGLASMTLTSSGSSPQKPPRPTNGAQSTQPPPRVPYHAPPSSNSSHTHTPEKTGKLEKKNKGEGGDKKKRHFFGL